MPETIGTPAMWGGFIVFLLFMLALDLGVMHRKPHAIAPKEALGWSIFWISLALLFNLGLFHFFGPRVGLEFLTGYVVEKALSVDNIFVFIVIFSYFSVPAIYQHRLLFWGVLGAIVLRIIFILAGAALLAKFHWIIYVFGGFLVLTGIRLLAMREEAAPDQNLFIRLFRRIMPITDDYEGFKLIVKRDGKKYATTLLLVLLTIEGTDVLFAVDSIPAVFAVTSDPFIVFTSNIFAILGLRALFFLLASVIEKFYLLKPALGLVLVFVGFKMLVSTVYPLPIGISLGVISGLLAGAVILSLLFPAREPHTPAGPAE
jgi:tellurite resistance protein TerC